MRHFIRTRIGNPADRLARRLRTARPGSVLILVVALLVLMALIGTAWLTTARTDRYSAQQNAENTKLELLLHSAVRLAESAMVEDLYSLGRHRPPAGPTAFDFDAYDASRRDAWLAARTPILDGSAPPTGPRAFWPVIGGSVSLVGYESPYAGLVDPSAPPPPPPPWLSLMLPVEFSQQNVVANNLRHAVVPTFIDVPKPDGSTVRHPAFAFPVAVPGYKFLAADTDGDGVADSALCRLPHSDGSGITYYYAIRIVDNCAAINATVAWKPGEAEPAADGLPAIPPGQFFPTNVNLYGMLLQESPYTADDQIAGLNRFRFTATPLDDRGMNGNTPFPVPPAARNPVVNDTGYALPRLGGMPDRTEFVFLSETEALWRQLGSRPGNPGWNQISQNPDIVERYKNLSVGESTTMAYRSVLASPSASPSALEADYRLGRSVYAPGVRNTVLLPGQPTPPYPGPYAMQGPYDLGPDQNRLSQPNEQPGWANNFFFDNGANFTTPLRPILVSRNAVSNIAPAPLSSFGNGEAYFGPVPWDTNRPAFDYNFGSRVRWKRPDEPIEYSYVCIRKTGPAAGGSVEPGTTAAEGVWELMPWHTVPSRPNINTATFGQLWLAYWSIMNRATPLQPNNEAPYPAGDTNVATSATRDRRMFRSPLRDPLYDNKADPPHFDYTNGQYRTTAAEAPHPIVYQMAPYEVMRLRAALAAVNAIDIRDADDDVTSRRITLSAYVNGDVLDEKSSADPIDVDVTVFGNEAQPFITEVYATNDILPPLNVTPTPGAPEPTANAQGYVAIELFNPTDQPISLLNWNLGIIDRRRPSSNLDDADVNEPEYPYPSMAIRPLTDFAGFGADVVIAPRSYLVLESYDPAAGGHRPLSSAPPDVTAPLPGTHYTVPSLHEVMRRIPKNRLLPGGELVLLRPRRADGTLENVVGTTPNEPNPNGDPYDPTNPYYEENAGTVAPAQPNVLTPQAQSLAYLVPIDSFDFTEFAKSDGNTFRVWHYARQSDATNRWACVYPGRWDSAHRWNPDDPYRQEGIDSATWTFGGDPDDPSVADQDPWLDPMNVPAPGITLGGASTDATYFNETATAGRPMFGSIQLNQTSFGGFNKPKPLETPWVFPFGGFARNGDLLQVPFIGAYTIRRATDGPGRFLEMNAITMDSVFAHDASTVYTTDPTPVAPDREPGDDGSGGGPADEHEQLGRFCPDPSSPDDTYRWAIDLFDHLTVQSPQDDHLPAAVPWSYPAAGVPPQGVNGVTSIQPPSVTFGRVNDTSPTNISFEASTNLAHRDENNNLRDDFYQNCRIRFLSGLAKGHQALITNYDANTFEVTFDPPIVAPLLPPVNGDLFQILGPSEDGVGIEGLVNVNTASVEVLAAVPMIYAPPGASAADIEDARVANRILAEDIVEYRDDAALAGVPKVFTSLFDLNKVPGFQERFLRPLNDPMTPLSPTAIQTADPGDAEGDYTPYDTTDPPPTPPTDDVTNDFESRYLMITRLSNLLTVRSDSYTVYVELQGWRGVGTLTPELVVQRRRAFIADRNSLTQLNRSLTTTSVPTD